MGGRERPSSPARPTVYCVVPHDLAARLHEPLRRHFADSPVEVVVQMRGRDRRAAADRRDEPALSRSEEVERRRIRNVAGRRIGERRATEIAIEAPAPPLPRRLRRYADRLVFVERLEPATEEAEDLDSGRLVTRFQAGERDAFTELYMRYFERVHAYLRIALRDAHEAEDATQQVFMRALEALPAYERRGRPFGAWLFTIVRNCAITQLGKQGRVDLVDPHALDPGHEAPPPDAAELSTLSWITDRELLMLIERLPLPQRQVLVLRYMLGLKPSEIADVLSTTPNHVSVLQYRALGYLRARLTSLGRAPSESSRDRSRIVRCPKQARVLRRRRFALSP